MDESMIMKRNIILLWINIIGLGACTQHTEIKEITPSYTQVNEYEAVLEYMKKAGYPMQDDDIPPLVDAAEIQDAPDDFYIIDLRPAAEYEIGHIAGARNMAKDSLMELIYSKAPKYQYIALVDNDGQHSTYIASLFRMLGFDNVKAMKWGMSAWNKKYAKEGWSKNVSQKYSGKLETSSNKKPENSAQKPSIQTGKSTVDEILKSRIHTLLSEEKTASFIEADEVYNHLNNYFIISYQAEEDYKNGHIPGTFHYKLKKSFIPESNLNSLPAEKTICMYCYSGPNTASTVAWLRLLGYDAKSILYGANGFMQGKITKKGLPWKGFDLAKDAYDYPMEKGEDPIITARKLAIKISDSLKNALLVKDSLLKDTALIMKIDSLKITAAPEVIDTLKNLNMPAKDSVKLKDSASKYKRGFIDEF